MITPLAYVDSLRIGSVDYVSPDEIKVLLDIEAPSNIALNTGVPRPFPRIGSYAILPSESGFLVAQIEWITIEHSQYPKRKGMQDFGVIDLPFPLRKMKLIPLGVLNEQKCGQKSTYSFSRGVDIFPTVGDPVLLPSQKQLRAIVESGENRRVKIGTSPFASNADVSVDPDRLFGRHLAILGNTGSGKSCSVAGVIRWSIEAAVEEKRKKSTLAEISEKKGESPGLNSFLNSRFIILDPNGEYLQAFEGIENVRLFAVEPDEDRKIKQLQIPLWFWNSAEWCAFTQASAKTQRPLLRRALRDIRRGGNWNRNSETEKLLEFRRYLSFQFIKIRQDIGNNAIKDDESKFGFYLKSVLSDLGNRKKDFLIHQNEIDAVISVINDALSKTYNTFSDRNGRTVEYYRAFELSFVQSITETMDLLIEKMGGIVYEDNDADEDTPLPFNVSEFADYLQMLGIEEKSSQFIDFLVMRIRTLLSDPRMKTITSCDTDLTLAQWLDDYICPSGSFNGAITIIDLSLVPAEVVHVVTAVIARMTLETLQRYRHVNDGHTLPTTLVMEEAHTFIRKYVSDSEETPSYSMCTQVFEKIAREGRKFGLGLVLSSQRPSELSQTVLSQCNTFLLHRISNDRDQELVKKLVPDNLHGLLRELPTLPSQRAILLGWASELPVMVQMNYLNKEQRPQSNDPAYWDTWVASDNEVQRVTWKTIADDWQRNTLAADNEVEAVKKESSEVAIVDSDDDFDPF